MRRLFYLFLLLALPLLACGQQFVYSVDFDTQFDNREYKSFYSPSQTLFGMRLTPLVGMAFGDSLGGTHLLRGGVTYMQPFGAPMKMGHLWPTIYYQFEQSGFSLNLGTVPYSELVRGLPHFMMSDSLRFAYPNIQGALFSYQSERGYASFFCDWRGLQSVEYREAFRLVLMGAFRFHWFEMGGYGQINHMANKAVSEPNLGVCDDILISPYVLGNFSSFTALDSIEVKLGYLGGYYTDRKAGDLDLSHGFLCDITLGWRFLMVKNSLYVGDGQMPYYSRYGSELYQGDPFYQSTLYNRTDLMVYLLHRSMVQCYFSWNMHYVMDQGLSHQQQLVLRFHIGSDMTKVKRLLN